jgi:hypothetical protein
MLATFSSSSNGLITILATIKKNPKEFMNFILVVLVVVVVVAINYHAMPTS